MSIDERNPDSRRPVDCACRGSPEDPVGVPLCPIQPHNRETHMSEHRRGDHSKVAWLVARLLITLLIQLFR